MIDLGVVVTVATLVAGFGATMLSFRVQREAAMHEQGERQWIPWADWLLLAATVISLLLVVLPIVAVYPFWQGSALVAASALSAAIVLVAGHVFALLAHYRLLLGGRRTGPRTNPEPAELVIVVLSAALAIAVAGGLYAALCRAA